MSVCVCVCFCLFKLALCTSAYACILFSLVYHCPHCPVPRVAVICSVRVRVMVIKRPCLPSLLPGFPPHPHPPCLAPVINFSEWILPSHPNTTLSPYHPIPIPSHPNTTLSLSIPIPSFLRFRKSIVRSHPFSTLDQRVSSGQASEGPVDHFRPSGFCGSFILPGQANAQDYFHH